MFGQILLNLLRGAITGELSNLLEKFKENNGEEKYRQLVAALQNSLLLLQDVAEDTKTKIDDTLIAILLQSLPQDDFTPFLVSSSVAENQQDQSAAEDLTAANENQQCQHPKAHQLDSGEKVCDVCGAQF